MSGTVEVERDGPLARVFLARAPARNALSRALIAELTGTVETLGRDDAVRLLLVGGRGPHFCAGADLEEMREAGRASRDDNLAEALTLGRLYEAVYECPKPVVARVHGAALGGGAGLVAACDLAIAATTASFGFTEVRLGLVPAVISPYVLRRIGERHARELFLTGERFDGARAEAIGLVQRAVPEAELDQAIGRTVDLLREGSPDAQARIKALLRAVSERPIAEARRLTPGFIAEARASADGQEGILAFFEKRRPGWR